MNIPPDASGRMNASVVEVMREAGRAINDTFRLHNAGVVRAGSGVCENGVVVVDATGEFDFIVTMEDLRFGQRIGNYSIDFRQEGSDVWEVLVPPVQPIPPPTSLGDHPNGKDPRDSHVGHKRIDVPALSLVGLKVAQVRFNCIRLVEGAGEGDLVFIRSLSLHKKRVPWEDW